MSQYMPEREYVESDEQPESIEDNQKEIVEIQTMFKQSRLSPQACRKFVALLKVFKSLSYSNYFDYLNLTDANIKTIKGKLEKSVTFKDFLTKIASNINRSQKKLKQVVAGILKNYNEHVESILKEPNIFGLEDFDEDSNIPQAAKRRVFDALFDDQDYKNFIKPKLVKEQLTSSLRILLNGFLRTEEQIYIDGIINEIITKRDEHLLTIVNTKDLSLAGNSKQNLVRAIQELQPFKTYIEKKGGDVEEAKHNISSTLFQFITYNLEIPASIKYSIIKSFLQNPSYNLAERKDISQNDRQAILKNLAESKVLENYDKIINSKKNLQDRKAQDIQNILSKYIQNNQKNALRGLLMNFKFKQFFEYPTVAARFKQFYKIIWEESPAYIEAYDNNNIDIQEYQKKFKRFLKTELNKKQISNKQAEEIIKKLVDQLDMSSIQNNKNLSENVRNDLIKTIESNDNFTSYRKVKIPERKTEWAVRRELQKFLAGFDIDSRNPYVAITRMVNVLIQTKQEKNIMKIEQAPSNQKDIKNYLVKNLNSLPLFKKFKQSMGIDMNNLEKKLRQTLFKQIRRVMGIQYSISLELINSIINSKQFENIKNFQNLTEKQKKELIDFTRKDADCIAYISESKKLDTIDSEKKFKNAIRDLIQAAKFDDEEEIDLLQQAYIDYCIIDKGLDDHPIEDTRQIIKKIKNDKKFKNLEREMRGDRSYEKYYEKFSEILKIRQQRIIGQFISTLQKVLDQNDLGDRAQKLKGDIIKQKDGSLIINAQCLNNQLKGKREAKAAYSALIKQEIYNQIKILQHVLKIRSDIIWAIELEKQQRQILEHEDFSYLNKAQKEQILKNLKEWSFDVVVKNERLSDYHKKKIIMEIQKKKIFIKYVTLLDNRNNVSAEIRQFIISYTSFCLQHNIEFADDLRKYIKNEVLIKVNDSDETEFPTSVKLQELKQKYQLEGSSNFFFYDTKLSVELFERLKYSEKVLNLSVKKTITVDFNGDKKVYQLTLNSTLQTALQEDQKLREKYFKVFDAEKNEVDVNTTIKDLKQQSLRVVLFRRVKIDGTDQPFESKTKVSELRALLKGKGEITNFTFNGEVLNQNKTFGDIFPNSNELTIKVNYKVTKTVEMVFKEVASSNFETQRRQGTLVTNAVANPNFSIKGLGGNFLDVYQKEVTALRQQTSQSLKKKFEEQEAKGTQLLYSDQKKEKKAFFEHYMRIFETGNEQELKALDKSVIKTPLRNKLLNQLGSVGGDIYSKLQNLSKQLQAIKKLK